MKTKAKASSQELYWEPGDCEQTKAEKDMRNMINSAFAYGGAEKGSYAYDHYIKRLYFDRVEAFDEVYEDQLAYLKKNCYVNCNVYTDHEGCTYNSIVTKPKSNDEANNVS
jgi:hypothetical protein